MLEYTFQKGDSSFIPNTLRFVDQGIDRSYSTIGFHKDGPISPNNELRFSDIDDKLRQSAEETLLAESSKRFCEGTVIGMSTLTAIPVYQTRPESVVSGSMVFVEDSMVEQGSSVAQTKEAKKTESSQQSKKNGRTLSVHSGSGAPQPRLTIFSPTSQHNYPPCRPFSNGTTGPAIVKTPAVE